MIVLTAFGSFETAVGAIRAGAYDFVTKPVEIEALAIAIRRAAEHRRLCAARSSGCARSSRARAAAAT